MSEFTPGKWAFDMLPRKIGAIPITTPREEIAYVCASSRAEANARLIAAAPEMYEMLKEELIPTSDYGGILSLSRTAKIRGLLAQIDGEEVSDE